MDKIGLYDVDSKIPNLALMKLSAYHKGKGDDVEWYSPLLYHEYDKIYASKVFDFSDNGYLHPKMIIGGSGHCLKTKLPEEIEHIYPDYSLYGINHAMGFITRGCIRNCKFCIVPEKEGTIRFNAPLEEFCKDQEKVLLLDNNMLAYPNHHHELWRLADSKKRIDFNQGLDIRLITKENAILLKKIRRWPGLRYRFALDDVNLISIVKAKLKILNEAGIKNSQCQFYVLIGFNSTPENDLIRIRFLLENKCDIFVMPYDKMDPYQKNFTRWVNRYFYKYQSFTRYFPKGKAFKEYMKLGGLGHV